MTVMVRDLLKLEKMADAEVIAGKEGLNKAVNRIATIEKPFSDHLEYSYGVARKGDLYLSKLYVFQNVKEKLHGELHFMIDTESCGLVIHRDVADFIDDHAKELADQNQIPIIVINKDYGFAELTYSVTDLVIRDKVAYMNENFIRKILSFAHSPSEIRDMLIHLNSNFSDHLQVAYVKGPEGFQTEIFQVEKTDFVQQFGGGLLCIFTSKESEYVHLTGRIANFLDQIKHRIPRYTMGVSEPATGLENAGEAIKEALYSNAYGEIFGKEFCRFADLGIYKLLVKLKDDKELARFRDEILQPIIRYEEENHISLRDVLYLYIQTDGNYKEIADQLFIHETTARYRMNKMYEIMKVKNKISFYTDVKTAILADTILKSRQLREL